MNRCWTTGAWVLAAVCALPGSGGNRATRGAAPEESPSSSQADRALRVGNLPVQKVLFLGNSITLHGPAPSIGWTGNWGMAASSSDRDYVHLLAQQLSAAAGGKPDVLVANIAEFERQYENYDVDGQLRQQLEFAADVVIVAIGENVPALATNDAQQRFRVCFERLLAALQRQGRAVLFVRSSFWPEPVKDAIMQEACCAAGGVFVDIRALGGVEANAARSERHFEHAGVAAHPGDQGMKAIAAALWTAIQQRALGTTRDE